MLTLSLSAYNSLVCRWPAVAECRACLLAEVRLDKKAPRLRLAGDMLKQPEVRDELKRRANTIANVISDKLGQMGSRVRLCSLALLAYSLAAAAAAAAAPRDVQRKGIRSERLTKACVLEGRLCELLQCAVGAIC